METSEYVIVNDLARRISVGKYKPKYGEVKTCNRLVKTLGKDGIEQVKTENIEYQVTPSRLVKAFERLGR